MNLEVVDDEEDKHQLPEPKPRKVSDAKTKFATRKLEDSELRSGVIIDSTN